MQNTCQCGGIAHAHVNTAHDGGEGTSIFLSFFSSYVLPFLYTGHKVPLSRQKTAIDIIFYSYYYSDALLRKPMQSVLARQVDRICEEDVSTCYRAGARLSRTKWPKQ